MTKKISAALISVFYKDGLEPVVRQLQQQGATIYSTGGTKEFIEALGIAVIPVEQLTSYPSILGGRVKTLHPSVFGGILGRRSVAGDMEEMKAYGIPEIDLVIVDLYPFIETVANTREEAQIIEKIDIGGPSMIRGAAKNFSDVAVIASRDDYSRLVSMLREGGGGTTLAQRRTLAAKAFEIVAEYDNAIAAYFREEHKEANGHPQTTVLRYGENPHQEARFEGNLSLHFSQLHGKELSYNNLVDVDAALELMRDFDEAAGSGRVGDSAEGAEAGGTSGHTALFAIIKHTNVCGIAARATPAEAWTDALAGDPESAFGGVLICNKPIDTQTATAINELFFEVLIAPRFNEDALSILQSKKNRILLQSAQRAQGGDLSKTLLNGTLTQQRDSGNFEKWEEVGGRTTSAAEKEDLVFANLVCKHLKSNAIALVKNRQLVGKGCGQTSRVDALRHALEKAAQFRFDLQGAVMASDAFFPFADCVELGKEAGITAFIQPGGSIRDKDSIDYCKTHNLAMVLTGQRHFKH